MKLLNLAQIKEALDIDNAIQEIENGFASYSKGDVNVPPVGHLPFPAGDCHIKYGHIKDSSLFVIKIATGFHENKSKGLPVCNGMMLIMSARTGSPVALLQDEGYLTNIRTAVAGLIAAKFLAPQNIKNIGIVGSGDQARLQLEYLQKVTDCRSVVVWNRNPIGAETFKKDMEHMGFDVAIASNLKELALKSNLIVTTTPSTRPLLKASWIQKGTHITAIGADALGKQELDEKIVAMADICAVDSYSQCMDHGEVSMACKKGLVGKDDLVEIGEIICTNTKGRTDDSQITLADLTGVAIQDIKIAQAVYESFIRC